MENLSAVYAPEANVSMISVHQICSDSDAFVMFFKGGAIGIKLNRETTTYLSKIKKGLC